MIRSVEFDLETKSEANQRFATKAGMFAKSARVQKQRAAVRDVLAAHFEAPRLQLNGAVNKLVVMLTRIAQGELDDDNLRGALKAVRDAIASWVGTNDRDPLIAWEYGQQRAAQHVYRVRVEIRDLAPGEPKVFILAETASAGRAAKSRVKRLVNAAVKGPTVRKAPARDAGDEQPARELADCTTCGAKVPTPCVRSGVERLVHGVHVARARAAGLHVEPDDRAAVKPARGVRRVVPPAQPALVFRKSWAMLPWEQPACPSCDGVGCTSEATEPTVYCPACKGTGRAGRRLAHLPRFDALDNPPPLVRYAVPPEHAARWPERTITLHRRPTSSPKLGEIWLYETTTPPKET